MTIPLDASALDQLFVAARTYSTFQQREVSDETLQALYELLKWGPTSANASPARFVFVKSAAAKQKLAPALSAGNLDKTLAAPVTVIVAFDLEFYEELAYLFPHTDAKSWFVGNEKSIQTTCMRNGSLQGAYLMLAARALGLDVGAMSGFDNAAVDDAFFSGTSWRSNFLVNLGYGEPAGLHARNPRLDFADVCRIE
ncbi:putative malonic semialdehyde reductase RutE [Andreprevotia sp. IGB-42]|uniref:malonic semialdehyde reductase n=1 Tax=Andreprevotia sp. IGB-42 TaxID=2497473 RepID=UPI001356736F|nr:malonic semialdehyde reductase [Andreprevotia sp. IGB-42]KAF0812745.1 putative malonic semialdehyde reductase RutE [Andreprevotia sp. IGB-42]